MMLLFLVVLFGISSFNPVSAAASKKTASKAQAAKPAIAKTSVKTPISISRNALPVVPKVPASAVTIDSIDSIIFGRTGVEIITLSDVMRPSLSGAPRSKDEIVFERSVILDAEQFHIAPDEEALNRYLETIQKENNLTLDQLKAVFNEAGYTYEEGREQFKRMQTVSSMLDYRIRSQLVVPRKQVEEYWAKNPVIQEASYQVQYGFVPFKGTDRQDQKKEIEQRLIDGRDPRGVSWQDPFWVDESEIAEDKMFITSLNVNQASPALNADGGFELYRLMNKKDKRVVPLEERYREITDILRRPKYEELLGNYKKQLFDSVSIVNLN